MKRYFIDTNIFLRAILEDHPTQSVLAQKVLTSVSHSKNVYFTTIWVIAEIVWTLDSFYKFPKNNIIEVIERIISSDIEVFPENLILVTLSYYKRINVDFVDCINYAITKEKKAEGIISFDKDFDILGTERIEP